MKKHILLLFLVLQMMSCGVSEDCFKGNGGAVEATYSFTGFTKIKVYDGVGLVIKEGADYEVKVKTTATILPHIKITNENGFLAIKDASTCNLVRDYGATTVYVTIPDGTYLPLPPELELHSKTDKTIASEGVLHSNIIRLFSIDLSDGAGTGDFKLEVANDQLVVESNNVSNFYLRGECKTLDIFFSWGDGIFAGQDLKIKEHVSLNHRGSNDMILYPKGTIYGNLYGPGDVILKNEPILPINVIQHFTGRLILQYL